MARWYDGREPLGSSLDALKTLSAPRRDKVVRGILACINERSPGLLDEWVLSFPLDVNKRRWYDSDPDLWLVFNGLEHADEELLGMVTEYLLEQRVQAAA